MRKMNVYSIDVLYFVFDKNKDKNLNLDHF